MHPTSQNTSHSAKMLYPFRKSRFVFGLGRHGDNYPSKRVHRHQKLGYHHLSVGSFQQIIGQISEKRIDNIHLTVQAYHNICHTVLFRRVNNARSDIQVIAAHGGERKSRRRRYFGSPFQIPFTTPFFPARRGGIVVNHAQSNEVILLRSEEHTSELQSRQYLVCRLLLENKTSTQWSTASEMSPV